MTQERPNINLLPSVLILIRVTRRYSNKGKMFDSCDENSILL